MICDITLKVHLLARVHLHLTRICGFGPHELELVTKYISITLWQHVYASYMYHHLNPQVRATPAKGSLLISEDGHHYHLSILLLIRNWLLPNATSKTSSSIQCYVNSHKYPYIQPMDYQKHL